MRKKKWHAGRYRLHVTKAAVAYYVLRPTMMTALWKEIGCIALVLRYNLLFSQNQ